MILRFFGDSTVSSVVVVTVVLASEALVGVGDAVALIKPDEFLRVSEVLELSEFSVVPELSDALDESGFVEPAGSLEAFEFGVLELAGSFVVLGFAVLELSGSFETLGSDELSGAFEELGTVEFSGAFEVFGATEESGAFDALGEALGLLEL